MKDNFDFDEDSIIDEDERFSELDAFLMYLQELKDEPRAQIVNLVRLKEFKCACMEITKAIMAENPDSKIKYSINNCGIGEGNIEITADEISVNDLKGFISGLKKSYNFEIHPLINGNIQMNILFHDILIDVSIETD